MQFDLLKLAANCGVVPLRQNYLFISNICFASSMYNFFRWILRRIGSGYFTLEHTVFCTPRQRSFFDFKHLRAFCEGLKNIFGGFEKRFIEKIN